MAIKNFPFAFKPLIGGYAIVDRIGSEVFHFKFEIVNKKGRIERFSWKPTKEEVVQNRVIRKHKYSKFAYSVLVEFWYLHND